MARNQEASSSHQRRVTIREAIGMVLEQIRAHAVYFPVAIPNPEPEPEPENQNPGVLRENSEEEDEPTPFYQSLVCPYSLWEKERPKQTSKDIVYVVGEGSRPIILEEPMPSPVLTAEERRAAKMEVLGIKPRERCSSTGKQKMDEIDEEWPEESDDEHQSNRKMKRKV